MSSDGKAGSPALDCASVRRDRLHDQLAESVLEMSESQVLREAREEGEDPSIVARRTRALLWAQVKTFRHHKLQDALDEYRRQVAAMRSKAFALPETAEGRRDLMATLFQRYPQMHSALLTVQHREFKALSDRDIESFLKQLQVLGVLPEAAGKAEAKDEGEDDD